MNSINNPTIEERILTLLQLTCLSEEEKAMWQELLPVLTEEEKTKLESNLLRQLNFEFEKGRKIGEEFTQIVQNHKLI